MTLHSLIQDPKKSKFIIKKKGFKKNLIKNLSTKIASKNIKHTVFKRPNSSLDNLPSEMASTIKSVPKPPRVLKWKGTHSKGWTPTPGKGSVIKFHKRKDDNHRMYHHDKSTIDVSPNKLQMTEIMASDNISPMLKSFDIPSTLSDNFIKGNWNWCKKKIFQTMINHDAISGKSRRRQHHSITKMSKWRT